MSTSKIVVAALAAAASLFAGMAQARGAVDVQWQVTIGSPVVVYPAPRVVVMPAPVYVPPPPRYVVVEPPYVPAYPPVHMPVYREPRHWDVDGDGIPNRRDRVYNPRWDRDGDGIPNRYDRHPRYGHAQWHHDRRHDKHDDRRGHRRGDKDDD
jgi:hypothetical protein